MENFIEKTKKVLTNIGFNLKTEGAYSVYDIYAEHVCGITVYKLNANYEDVIHVLDSYEFQ